jgi:hypothetical protein
MHEKLIISTMSNEQGFPLHIKVTTYLNQPALLPWFYSMKLPEFLYFDIFVTIMASLSMPLERK